MHTLNRIGLSVIGLSGLVTAWSSTAYGFVEEGFNCTSETTDTSMHLCATPGDLLEASSTGCNPWYDYDANYSYRATADQRKSSLHFNMTMALAAAAGYDKCAAFAVALYAQATDVAIKFEELNWAPLPSGVTLSQCQQLFSEQGMKIDPGLNNLTGASASTPFTYRTTGTSLDDAEIRRESSTFHWNATHDSLANPYSTVCTTDPSIDNPEPVYPKTDIVTMSDLYKWADDGVNTLNQCSAYDDGLLGSGGPITEYCLAETPIKPGTLAAFGVFLHPFQDSFSHSPILNAGMHDHESSSGDTLSKAGFVSSHYAGEFGVLPSTGKPGYGVVQVTTPAGTYDVELHSQDTVNAIKGTYTQLKDWISTRSSLKNPDHEPCSDAAIENLAIEFASIPNYVPASGEASGAKRRSNLADSFFQNPDCSLYEPDDTGTGCGSRHSFPSKLPLGIPAFLFVVVGLMVRRRG